MLHPDIDEVWHPGRADAHHASLQQTLPGVEPILYRLFSQGKIGLAWPHEMHMHIPETRQQIGTSQIDHGISLAYWSAMTVQHFDDPPVLHGHAGTRDRCRINTVDQVGIGQDEPHGRFASRFRPGLVQ